MIRIVLIALVLVLAAPFAGPARAGEPKGAAPDHIVIQMAQHLLTSAFDLDHTTRFEPATVHPQPQAGPPGRYWAVVGRVSIRRNQYAWDEKVYVAAVLQTCGEYKNVAKCWKLQKAAIDNKIMIDHGDPPTTH